MPTQQTRTAPQHSSRVANAVRTFADATSAAAAAVCVAPVFRYIIGLPLHQRNATALSRQLMITAKKELGPALKGFELGNEVSACASVYLCGGGGGGVSRKGKQGEVSHASFPASSCTRSIGVLSG
jgi:hypothetical protein